MSDSEECFNDCIGKGYNFCPVTNKTLGYCCTPEVDCPKETICSFSALDAKDRLKAWSCP